MNLSSGLYHQIQCSVRFIHVLLLQNSSSNSPASANKHPQPKPATALPSSPSKLTPWPGNWSSPLCNISAGKVKGNVTNNLARKTWGRKKNVSFKSQFLIPAVAKPGSINIMWKEGKEVTPGRIVMDWKAQCDRFLRKQVTSEILTGQTEVNSLAIRIYRQTSEYRGPTSSCTWDWSWATGLFSWKRLQHQLLFWPKLHQMCIPGGYGAWQSVTRCMLSASSPDHCQIAAEGEFV